jgi:shikimate kinase
MNVIFLGMKHCGKSTCSASVAQRLDVPCLDTDDLMSDLHKQERGERLSAKEIFSKYGQEFFKELEVRAVRKLAQELAVSSRDHIIALGGGTPMNGDLLTDLKAVGAKVIYLKADPVAIFSRIKSNGPSRFLQGDNPLASLIEVSQQREPFYLNSADVVIDTSKVLGIEAMVDAALEAIKDLQKEER